MVALLFDQHCLPKSNNLGLAVNIIFSLFFGMRLPKLDANTTMSDALKVPFWFREFRIIILLIGLLINFGRLIYEIILYDLSIILVIFRISATIIQLIDHCWLCKNWEPFFVNGILSSHIW